MKCSNMDKRIEQLKDGTFDLTNNGKCTGCGECCSNLLPMANEEISTIRKYIKKYNIKENKHIFPLANHLIDMTCPFLDDSKKCDKCKIYEVRPKICRDFSCRPSDRPPIDLAWGMKCRPVNVREEFYR